MKAILRTLLPALALLPFLLSCGKDEIKLPAKINYFQFGYRADTSDESSRFEEGQVDASSFVFFADRNSLQAAIDKDYTNDAEFKPSKYMYSPGECVLEVVTNPKTALIQQLDVTSSDPSVMSVLGVDGNYVHVKCHKLGETTLSVRVRGAMNSLDGEFPIQVTDDCRMDFYITPFWLSGMATRLRFRPTKLPLGYDEVPVLMRDSVTVCGSCTYGVWNAEAEQIETHVAKDSVKLAREDIVRLVKKKRKDLVRNISDEIRQVRKWYVDGQRLVHDLDTDEYYVEDYRFHYQVETVILDFYMVTDSPYVDFYFTSKCERTNVFYRETGDGDRIRVVEVEGETDKDGAVACDPDSEQGRRLEEYEANYFVVELNYFLTEKQKEEIVAEFQKDLDAAGYDPSDHVLSEEDKDRQMAEIEKHKKEGDD